MNEMYGVWGMEYCGCDIEAKFQSAPKIEYLLKYSEQLAGST